MKRELEDRIAGVLLGTAVGDALGLPREGLSRRRAQRLFGGPPIRHAFALGRGMLSDDTEHAAMVALALHRHTDDPGAFARCLAWQLRWWLARLPAGIGWATLRSILRLWIGFPAASSGVRSAGNGPAMRSAVLGVCLGDDCDRLRAFVSASTHLTHRHPEAEEGALAVALAAGCAASTADMPKPAAVLAALRSNLSEPRLIEALDLIQTLTDKGETGEALAAALDLERGVTGYVCHTVPVALMCWLRSPDDYRRAVEEVILLGGDTDTTGAIVGALAGATVGAAGIPDDWLGGLSDWPLSRHRLEIIAAALAAAFEPDRKPTRARRVAPFWPGSLLRNPLFTVLVLGHGLRRLLPPY